MLEFKAEDGGGGAFSFYRHPLTKLSYQNFSIAAAVNFHTGKVCILICCDFNMAKYVFNFVLHRYLMSSILYYKKQPVCTIQHSLSFCT